jgi:hypothetical protein
MKATADRSSPWGQRLWFEGHEFDAMMDEVRLKAGQEVITPGQGVDVESIFERVYGVVPDYDDLPEGILGKTVFLRDGRFEVLLSRSLSDLADGDVVARRRLRSTLAHECAHVVEHGHLHLIDSATLPLFGEAEPPPPRVLCRGESMGNFKPGKHEWWEYQANRGMASLLLPRRLVTTAMEEGLAARGFRSIDEALRASAAEPLVRDLMQTFDASMQLVTYRMQELGLLPVSMAQTQLVLEARED